MRVCPRITGLTACLLFSCLPCLAQASQRSDPARYGNGGRTGRYSVATTLKYDSNLDLAASHADGPDRDDVALEVAARGQVWRTLGRFWLLGLHGSMLTDLYRRRTTEDWLYGRGGVSLTHRLSSGVLEFSDQVRYYSKPRHDDFDFVRNVALLAYRRPISERWQLGGGVDQVSTRYLDTRCFDYTITGANLEARTVWSEGLSTYCQWDLQFYTGTATPQDPDPRSSPDEGTRWTVRLGLDWLPMGSQGLSLTYAWRTDQAELGVSQIGEFEGHEDSQDSEAEFDLTKQRATALYTLPLSRRVLLSTYLEFIDKHFDDDADALLESGPGTVDMGGLTDRLLLSSTHLRVRITPHLSARLRYLFRTNDSTQSSRAYTDHIISLGMVFRN